MNSLKRPRSLHASVFAYFVLSGGRFTAPFLENIAGFSDTLNGAALAVQVAMETIIGPLAGSFADKLERRYPHRGRAIVMSAGVFIGTTAFVMHGVVSWACSDDALSCTAKVETIYHMALRIIFSIGNAVVYPVLNGITLAFLDEEGCAPSKYGKERLYGAISWAIASVVIGPIIDRWGFQSMLAFAPFGAALYLFTIIVFVRGLEERNTGSPAAIKVQSLGEKVSDEQEQQNQASHSLFRLLAVVCGTVYGLGFLISMITLRMGMSIVESLIFLFFEGLGGSYTTMGLTVVVTVVFEIPIFHLAPKLLDRLGPGRLQQIASVAYMTRVIGYTLIPQGAMAWVLLLEPLHGVTYGCAATSSVEYVAQLSPKGSEASGQGLLAGLGGIGSIIGLSVGGWAEDTLGAKVMYRSYATVVAIGLAIFLFTDAWRGRYHRLSSSEGEGGEGDTCATTCTGAKHIELSPVMGKRCKTEGEADYGDGDVIL